MGIGIHYSESGLGPPAPFVVLETDGLSKCTVFYLSIYPSQTLILSRDVFNPLQLDSFCIDNLQSHFYFRLIHNLEYPRTGGLLALSRLFDQLHSRAIAEQGEYKPSEFYLGEFFPGADSIRTRLKSDLKVKEHQLTWGLSSTQ